MSESKLWDMLCWMPPSLLRVCGRVMASIHYRFDRRHVKECEHMVRLCRDDWDAHAIIKGMYHSLWQIPVDICYYVHMSESEIDEQIKGLDELLKTLHHLDPKRGIIFVTAHFGAWELGSQIVARRFRPIMSVYKASKREWINRFFRAARNRHGQSIVEKEGSMVSLFKSLKKGGAVGLVMDQHGGKEGVPSRFLGRPCRSWDSVVVLAQRTECPVMAVGFIREAQGYRVTRSELLEFPKKFQSESERLEAVAKVDEALSRLVEQAPEQWMWLGRRWGRNYEAQMAESLGSTE